TLRVDRAPEPVSGAVARWRAPSVLQCGSDPGPPLERKSPGNGLPDRACGGDHADDFRHLERHSPSGVALAPQGKRKTPKALDQPRFGPNFALSLRQLF